MRYNYPGNKTVRADNNMKENVLKIKTRGEFRQWLTLNSSSEKECWINLKRGRQLSPDVFNYPDAIKGALCFGRLPV